MMTTRSPLDDPKIAEATQKEVRAELGENAAAELFTSNRNDAEDKLDMDNIVDYKTDLGFDIYIRGLLDTDHLKNFDKFDKYLGLDGEAYSPYKKCLWYLAQSLKQETITYDINYKTKIDNRINILAIAPPASGKTTSKNKMKRFVSRKEVFETSGLSHPQQLIGKTIAATQRKPKKEIPGILSYKFVIHDEVQDMLNEKNPLYSASQKIKRQAMDVFGDNQLDKKLVSNEYGEETICISPSRFLDFAHPKKLESPFFDTGSFRRYFIFDLVADDFIDLKSLTEFKLDGDSNYNTYPLDLSEQYKDNKRIVKFNQQNLDIISHCHKTLLKFLLNCKNENAFRYGMMMRYNFRSVISKMVFILALANKERIPSIKTTIMACRDTLLFVFETIKAINKLANISTTSDLWQGLDENNALALTWLLRRNCISIETSDVSINKFWTVLCHIHGLRITQARSHFYRLKKDGYVDSKKGKHDSKVWLKFIPKELKLIGDEEDSLEFLDKIALDCRTEKPLLTTVREIFTDDKTYEKVKTAGIAGVFQYILFSIRVEALTLYYIKNIYSINVLDPTPENPTLYSKDTEITLKPIAQDFQTKEFSSTVSEENKVEEEQSTRDTQYFDAKECENIKPCSKEEVLSYIKDNPNTKQSDLIKKFGPGIIALKKEGLFK